MRPLQIRHFPSVAIAGVLLSLATSQHAFAQTQPETYLNPALPAEQRAADLVHRMTLEEKASQLVNQARPIPRLKVPGYDWWSEALHGVARNGVTELPEPIGLAAPFDTAGIHDMAHDIGVEGRILHRRAAKDGNSKIFEGLDFWAPNLNIFRDPRWGRGQETYGEDPFLTAHMGVSYVTGMQGDDPRYYLAIATPKHFAVHSGPEPTRHIADVDVSRHDQMDTYEPAFRAAVVEGKAGSIMCAYNAVDGEPACANHTMLESDLREKWGFRGYVVSDCGAVRDIFTGHRFRPSQPKASAISLTRGMDNECIDFLDVAKDDHDYRPYIDAVQQGYMSEATMDTALVRLFTARIRLGMFDPPEMVPYQNIDDKELDSAEHRALANKLANESMVLLKNDGTLPLRPDVRRIAVVGPLADQTRVLLGNYNGTPTHSTSVLDALKAEFPHASITFVPGTQFLRNEGTPVPSRLLTTSEGKPGLEAVYSERRMDDDGDANQQELLRRNESGIALTGGSLPAAVAGKHPLRVTWTGVLTPTTTGDYLLGVRSNGSMRLRVDDRLAALQYGSQGAETRMAHVHLIQGVGVRIEVTYGASETAPEAQLLWAPVNNAPSPEAIAAARQADLTVAVVGITSELEGEEMPVDQPGFLGGDRTSLNLPDPEEALIEQVAATGKPLVVVLMNGSALSVNWIQQHANAVLESWYSGEEGGNAIAATLSGKNNPAGRLPLTFYSDVSQLPNFEDYSMQHRTYRYFDGKPLYPFGYGLSYTTFAYSDLQLSTQSLTADQPLEAQVKVTNTGKRNGDEVVQLYLEFPKIPGAPRVALRGFTRIHLDAGASQTVHLTLRDRDLSMVTEDGLPMVAEGDYTITIGGGQPGTGAAGQSTRLHILGNVHLPE